MIKEIAMANGYRYVGDEDPWSSPRLAFVEANKPGAGKTPS